MRKIIAVVGVAAYLAFVATVAHIPAPLPDDYADAAAARPGPVQSAP